MIRKTPNRLVLTARLADYELRSMGIFPNIPMTEIAAALSIAEARERRLAHYVVVADARRVPTLYNVYRLGFGQPRLTSSWLRRDEAVGRLTALLRSSLAEPHLDYEIKRDSIGDLRWLRDSLMEIGDP